MLVIYAARVESGLYYLLIIFILTYTICIYNIICITNKKQWKYSFCTHKHILHAIQCLYFFWKFFKISIHFNLIIPHITYNKMHIFQTQYMFNYKFCILYQYGIIYYIYNIIYVMCNIINILTSYTLLLVSRYLGAISLIQLK